MSPPHWEVTSLTAFGRLPHHAVRYVPTTNWPRPRRDRTDLDWLRATQA